MFSNSELFSSVTKVLFESQLTALNALTITAFESVEKGIAMNLAAAKAAPAESAVAAKQLSSAKDPQEFLALAVAQAKSNAEKMMSYSRHLTDIVSSNQVQFTKTAEAQFAESSRKVNALVDAVTKNAPAGSENAVAILKSAIDNANAGYEHLTKLTKQAVETVDAHFAKAAKQ